MPVNLDTYTKALVRTQVSIDSASRVFLKDQQLEIHTVGGVRKVQLPNTKFLISLDDLVANGAKVLGGRTPRSLALDGSEARWADQREARAKAGLPPNVYIANARSIQYALDNHRVPPPVRYIGRRQEKMTEVYDTIDEVVTAMNTGSWRTQFSKGRYARRKS